jgi:hypothetical protein
MQRGGDLMKPWVQPFLEEKGDSKISKEELARDLQIPIFCYRRLSDFFFHDFSDRIKTLFGTFLANLEPGVFCQLATVPNLCLHNVTKIASVRRINRNPYPDLPIEMAEFSRLSEMTDLAVIGAIAHEMAHVYLSHNDRVTVGLNLGLENEADTLVKQWGFEFELMKSREFLKKQKKGEQDNG